MAPEKNQKNSCTEYVNEKKETHEIMVPQRAVGLVIGKSGDMIRKLQQDSGAKISFPSLKNETFGDKPCVIGGYYEQIKIAVDAINKLIQSALNQDWQSTGSGRSSSNRTIESDKTKEEIPTIYFAVPIHKVGLVIGKGGQIIKGIEKKSGAIVSFKNVPSYNTQEKNCIIQGQTSQIECAKTLINERIGVPGKVVQIQLPSQSSQHSYEQVMPDKNDSKPALLPSPKSLTNSESNQFSELSDSFGDRNKISPVQKVTVKKEPESPSKNTNKSTFGVANAPNLNCHPERQEAISSQVQFAIPAFKAGIVIGKGGSNVKRICQESGARINVGVINSAYPEERICHIRGYLPQIEHAKKLIIELIGASGRMVKDSQQFHSSPPVSQKPLLELPVIKQEQLSPRKTVIKSESTPLAETTTSDIKPNIEHLKLTTETNKESEMSAGNEIKPNIEQLKLTEETNKDSKMDETRVTEESDDEDNYEPSSNDDDTDEDYIPTARKLPQKKRVAVKQEPKSTPKRARRACTKPVNEEVSNDFEDNAAQNVKSELQDDTVDNNVKSATKVPKSRKRKVADTGQNEEGQQDNEPKPPPTKRKRTPKKPTAPKPKPPPKRPRAPAKSKKTKGKTGPNLESENIDPDQSNINTIVDVEQLSIDTYSCVLESQKMTRLWRDEDLICETVDVPVCIVKNIIRLFEQECTIPFIARYRKELTGNLDVEKLRDIKEMHEAVKVLKKKVDNILKTIDKEQIKIDDKTIHAFLNAKTMEEVEFLYVPFKPGSKKSLAERSKQLGLETPAKDILNGKMAYSFSNISQFIKPEISGISNEAEVTKGIQHIIADIIAKDRTILDFLHNHYQRPYIVITSAKSATAVKEEKKAIVEGKELQNFKFENYFNFRQTIRNIQSHHILALNRGESLKVLTVKLSVPSNFKNSVMNVMSETYTSLKNFDFETLKFVNNCCDDAYSRLLEPHLFRQLRSELTKKAHKESTNVFCTNLKRLLLTPPVRGKTVIGIDPGFKHGCKVAVLSVKGEVLKTDVIHPHNPSADDIGIVKRIIEMVKIYNATVVAIGNGTACRETEEWLSNLIKNKAFDPHIVKYCIVNESGASIYSVTKEAEAELPNMDPNLRSAVSIGRRLQDPLLEYVKVEPKHLGVGMYQHDLPETMIKNALDGVVVECVSFVGVDLNVCSELLLRKISGLSATRAKQIIQWREKNGCFINRQQLLEVKGLGPKSFEQCAGFVKILPQTSAIIGDVKSEETSTKGKRKAVKSKKNTEHNPLDSTIIHPESYEIAERVLVEINAVISEIGQESLLKKVSNYMKFSSVKYLAEKLNAVPEQVQLIVDVFNRPIEYDIREEFDVPLFKMGVKSLEDLKINQILTGRVMNVTNFGAFTDIGVGVDGLIHVSKMRKTVQLGETLSVRILSVDIQKKRISLAIDH